jgi:DNA mismatch repair protein MutS
MAKKSLTPAMEQWRREKERHPDKLLLFRMGDFYELFYDDAKVVSRVLGLTLTSRSKGENPVPMAGIPHHALERYLKELIEKGHKAAICDQLEDPATAKGVVKRGVTRVVTPGTVLEESCLPAKSNNFLAAVAARGDAAGLAYVDLSTGEFLCSALDLEMLGDELERLAPAETLLPAGRGGADDALGAALRYRDVGVRTEREGYHFDPDDGARHLREHFGVATLDGFGLADLPEATGACAAVLAYLRETQMNELRHIRAIRRVAREDCLLLDRATQRNLELTHALMAGGKSGTLLEVIDRTRTGPGARRLKGWLLRPLAQVAPIRRRQEAVAELMEIGRAHV